MALTRNSSIVSAAPSTGFKAATMDYNISQITPYLFVTAEDTARQFPRIFSNGIGCVINVANELPQMFFPPQTGIQSLKYPIQDNPTFPASNFFDVVADRIAANVAANRRTLLYCHYGRSRSVTFTLAYLIKHHKLPLQTAFALVKQRRQIAAPNVGFWSQLRSYELRQQQSLVPAVVRNFQSSLDYGQRIANQLTNGFGRAISQIPFVNTWINPMQSINSKRNPYIHCQPLRMGPLIYSRPYYFRHPLRIRRPYAF